MSLTDDQIALRRTGITGTDLPALLGLSPWRTAFDVWLEKLGKAPAVEITDDLERGIYLEEGARQWYAHRTGASVTQPGTVVCQRHGLIIATPDGLATLPGGEVRALEIKMPSGGHGWGEPGTDAIPDYYLPQVAWECAALEVGAADVFAVVDGKPRLYHVTRDFELEDLLIETAERFWWDHVLPQKPPEVQARDAETVSRWLRRSDTCAHVEYTALPPETQVAIDEYLYAYRERQAAEERESLWEARAQLALLGAPGVRGLPEESGFHRVDWTTQKGRTYTDWKAVQDALKDEDPAFSRRMMELIQQHTTTREGNRPFTPRPLTKGSKR